MGMLCCSEKHIMHTSGPIFADILLSHCELKCLDDCLSDFKPIFCCRYVDDTFVVFSQSGYISDFTIILILNINVLNLLMILKKMKSSLLLMLKLVKLLLATKLVFKPTNTELHTDFNSFTPKSYKLGVVCALCHQTIPIYSKFSKIANEIDTIFKIFQQSSYPAQLLRKITMNSFIKWYS